MNASIHLVYLTEIRLTSTTGEKQPTLTRYLPKTSAAGIVSLTLSLCRSFFVTIGQRESMCNFRSEFQLCSLALRVEVVGKSVYGVVLVSEWVTKGADCFVVQR